MGGDEMRAVKWERKKEKTRRKGVSIYRKCKSRRVKIGIKKNNGQKR